MKQEEDTVLTCPQQAKFVFLNQFLCLSSLMRGQHQNISVITVIICQRLQIIVPSRSWKRTTVPLVWFIFLFLWCGTTQHDPDTRANRAQQSLHNISTQNLMFWLCVRVCGWVGGHMHKGVCVCVCVLTLTTLQMLFKAGINPDHMELSHSGKGQHTKSFLSCGRDSATFFMPKTKRGKPE